MIELAAADLRSAGVTDVDLRVMDAENLEFPDARFDALTGAFMLFFLPDPVRAAAEFHRVLRPGGQLRFFEHVAAPDPGLLHRTQRLVDATVWPRIAGNCHTHRHTEQTIVGAGFQVSGARREWVVPAWVPVPWAST